MRIAVLLLAAAVPSALGIRVKDGLDEADRSLRQQWYCKNGSWDFWKFMCVCKPGWKGSRCTEEAEKPIFGKTDENCDDPSLNLSCDWYKRCLANHLPGCRDDEKEYAVNYGFRFCSAFTEQLESFSERGQLWVEKVKLCLQRALVVTMDQPTSNCTIVRAHAFDSHPECYVHPDPENDPDLGICELLHQNPSDVYHILRITRSALVSSESAKQIFETAIGCGNKWTKGIFEAAFGR